MNGIERSKMVWTVAAAWAICLTASGFASAQDEGAQLEVDRADEWHFNVTPYAWLAGMDGDITVKGFETEADVDFGDILDVLDFGAIGHFEAGKGRWSVMTDLVYMAVSEDGDTPGPIFSDIEVEMDALILEVGGAYKVYETDSSFLKKPFSLWVLGGLRYTDLEVDVDTVPAIPGSIASKDWLDPFVGFRTQVQWTKRWSSNFRADIGGFGVGSDFAYQIASAQVVALTDRLDFVVGFRTLSYDYEDGSGTDEFEYDVTMSGPIIGMNIGF